MLTALSLMFPYYLFWLKLSCPTFLIICLAKGSKAPYLLEFLVHGVDKSSCLHDVVHGSASVAYDNVVHGSASLAYD